MRIQHRVVVETERVLFPASVEDRQTLSTVQRDLVAIVLAQKLVATMATTAPSDSWATGSITAVEGSTTGAESISIQALGTGETSETMILMQGRRALAYSNPDANDLNGFQSVQLALELVVSDWRADLLALFFLDAFNSQDEAFRRSVRNS